MHALERRSIGLLALLALAGLPGCWGGGTTRSRPGGVSAQDESFSITVPGSRTVQQGEAATVVVLLNRGAYFKRDVVLDFASEGIEVSPTTILVKASDKAEAPIRIAVAREAAIGEYRIRVKGTPSSGEPTSTEFTVKVVAQ